MKNELKIIKAIMLMAIFLILLYWSNGIELLFPALIIEMFAVFGVYFSRLNCESKPEKIKSCFICKTRNSLEMTCGHDMCFNC